MSSPRWLLRHVVTAPTRGPACTVRQALKRKKKKDNATTWSLFVTMCQGECGKCEQQVTRTQRDSLPEEFLYCLFLKRGESEEEEEEE